MLKMPLHKKKLKMYFKKDMLSLALIISLKARFRQIYAKLKKKMHWASHVTVNMSLFSIFSLQMIAVNPTCMSFNCGRKPEYPRGEPTQQWGNMHLHTERLGNKLRTSWLWGSSDSHSSEKSSRSVIQQNNRNECGHVGLQVKCTLREHISALWPCI